MTQTITPLRQRMLDDMKLRNMVDGTRRTYIRSVADFSAFHGRSPTSSSWRTCATTSCTWSPAASRPAASARSLALCASSTPSPSTGPSRRPASRSRARPTRLPAILSREEVARLLAAVADLWMRALLTTVYAAGPRVSEVVGLQVTDIEHCRKTLPLHVQPGQ